jgi:4-hydroxy-tetrahydrodipicolinate reductase
MLPLRIIIIGFGQIGRMVFKQIAEMSEVKVVGVVDSDEELTGKDAGRIVGLNACGEVIANGISCMRGVEADGVILTTVSSADAVAAQIEELAILGLPIVTTCEELSYPWIAHAEASKKIDNIAKKHDISVLGTGVNPGFLMDFLPVVLSGICRKVDAVKVARVQDASIRRVQFQRKIGAGLDLEQFELRRQEGSLRHVGLTESIHMIAEALGWKLDKVEETLEPVIAENAVASSAVEVVPGQARGVKQAGRGYVDGKEVITLDFVAALGEPESYDEVSIEGCPAVNSRIAGGVNGDIASVAITVNAMRRLINYERKGLLTMLDIPVISCRYY